MAEPDRVSKPLCLKKLTTMKKVQNNPPVYKQNSFWMDELTGIIQTKLIYSHETADFIMDSVPYISGNGVIDIYTDPRSYLPLMETL